MKIVISSTYEVRSGISPPVLIQLVSRKSYEEGGGVYIQALALLLAGENYRLAFEEAIRKASGGFGRVKKMSDCLAPRKELGRPLRYFPISENRRPRPT